MEKLVLALIISARKLRPYFQGHPITVYTTYPIRSILHKPELSGRLTKWAVELGEHDITYQPRTAIKSQALADFVADFSPTLQAKADMEVQSVHTTSIWKLAVDGSSNKRGCGIGIVLISPEGDVLQQAIKCGFKVTNNES